MRRLPFARPAVSSWRLSFRLMRTTDNSGDGGSAAPFGSGVSVSVDTNAEEYRRMAQELALLSTDEFGRRLYRFSRANFDPSQTAAVHAHISELLNRRLAEVSYKCVREYGQLAHVAKLHDLCLAVYYARANLISGPSMSAGDNAAGGFAVSDSVVDSAYSLGSTSDLVRLGSYCVKHLQHVPSLGWEVMSSFSLVRTFWRCVCLAANHEKMGSVDAKQAFSSARHIFEEYIAQMYPDASKKLNVWEVIHTVRRFVQYATCGDEGEMLFFRFCLQKGLLRRVGDSALQKKGAGLEWSSVPGADDVAYSGSGTSGVEGGVISEEQWFYATLIATCRAGQHVHEALHYFDEVGTRLGVERVGYGVLLRPRPWMLLHGPSVTEQTSHSMSVDEKVMEGVSDYLFFQLLSVLHAAKDNKRIVFTARAVLRSGGNLSISVWSIVLIAAGEMRAADVANAAFVQARRALIDEARIEDRRGYEYLLRTSVLALSKCQVPRFEEEYLHPYQSQITSHSYDEFYMCALLQNAHNSTDPEAGAEEVVRILQEKCLPLTSRIVSRLMKIYLRIESPKLLELYKHATQGSGIFKTSWLGELLLWADRRRYNLTSEERKYILNEVHRVYGKGAMGGDLSGLRTQLALLRYDYEHNPREVFLETSRPPPTEPTILDSRAHFLLKKPHCIQRRRGGRGVMGLERDHATAAAAAAAATATATAVRGDRRSTGHAIIQGQNFRGTDGGVRPDEFRIYMGKMLEAMQRTNNWAK